MEKESGYRDRIRGELTWPWIVDRLAVRDHVRFVHGVSDLELVEMMGSAEADRRRELNAAAREADPILGGFATLEARGPDGLVPDEAARRVYFGETLAPAG